MKQILWLLSLLLIFLGCLVFITTPVNGAPPTQMMATLQPKQMTLSDRLAPPPTVYPPSQADLGAQVYYQVCMTCHGDRGQGLTDEWRNVIPPPENNCWASRCHAPNHPAEGFLLPHQVPPIIGPGFLASYGTATKLHDFVQSKMPYQTPRSLKPDEYWQLTVFVLRLNGYNLGNRVLDEKTAPLIDISRIPEVRTWSIPLLLALIFLGCLSLGVRMTRMRRKLLSGH
jgi:hypothetical protein